MAITSDFTGWVPAGTPHHSGFQNPSMTWLAPAPAIFDYETTGLIMTAIVFYYAGQNISDFLAPKPHTPPWDLMPHPDEYLFPNSDGRGMWSGPGVVYYAT